MCHIKSMAYHGYIPLVKAYLSRLESPKVLEIGLDRGVTTIPLMVFMTRCHASYEFVGIDVAVQEQLQITLRNIDKTPDHRVRLLQENSLKVLPRLVDADEKFDVVLIDGDHNYYTVQKELQHLEALTKSTSLVVIDDYHGRWSDRDLWYAERTGYEGNSEATTRIETEKHGVKAAVDEFLEANTSWESKIFVKGEPIVLYRKKASMFDQNALDLLP